jgi:outer membrane receptor protein involved in Fe transport
MLAKANPDLGVIDPVVGVLGSPWRRAAGTCWLAIPLVALWSANAYAQTDSAPAGPAPEAVPPAPAPEATPPPPPADAEPKQDAPPSPDRAQPKGPAGSTAPSQRTEPDEPPAPAPPPQDRPAEGLTYANPEGGQVDLGNLDLQELLNIRVVTATGHAEDKSLSPANLVVYTREEIALRGWRSLAEMLAVTPGFYVTDDLVQPALAVRGVTGGLRSGSRLVRIMVNGVPVNFRPDLSAFLGPENIPIEAVERVEIAKGPLSALYGANAFLAVVNIITREPEGDPGGDASPPKSGFRGSQVAGRVRSGAHQSGTGASGLVSYRRDGFRLMGAVSADAVDRSDLRIERTFAAQDPRMPQYAPYFYQQSHADTSYPMSAFGQVGYSSKSLGELWVDGGLQSLDRGAEFQPNSVYTHESRIALNNHWVSLHHDRQWTSWLGTSLWASFSEGGTNRNREQLFLTGNPTYSFHRSLDYQAFDGQLRYDLTPLDKIRLSAGADYTQERQRILSYTQVYRVAAGDRFPGEQIAVGRSPGDSRRVRLSNLGVFLQASGEPLPPLPDLRLTGNVRVDHPGNVRMDDGTAVDLFPAQYSWRGALAYRWSPQVSTKLIAGEAFQTPSAVMLFARPGFGAANNIIGNRNLQGVAPLEPQRSRGLELSTSAELLGHLAVEASVYGQEIRDRIAFERQGANYIALNAEDSEWGVGAELATQLVLDSLRPFLSVAWHRAMNAQRRALAIAYPALTALGGMEVRGRELPLALRAEVLYAAARNGSQTNVLFNNGQDYELPPYADINLTLSTQNLHLVSQEGETRLLLRVDNLLDERHSEPGELGFDLPTLGRTALFELRQSL